jgi:hypothetical protein
MSISSRRQSRRKWLPNLKLSSFCQLWKTEAKHDPHVSIKPPRSAVDLINASWVCVQKPDDDCKSRNL